MALFSNLINTLRDSDSLLTGMSKPEGSDIDVAALIGALPFSQGMRSSINRNTQDIGKTANPMADTPQSDAVAPSEMGGMIGALANSGSMWSKMFNKIDTEGLGGDSIINSGSAGNGSGGGMSRSQQVMRRTSGLI